VIIIATGAFGRPSFENIGQDTSMPGPVCEVRTSITKCRHCGDRWPRIATFLFVKVKTMGADCSGVDRVRILAKNVARANGRCD